MNKTISRINQLPTPRIQEVNDFVEFIMRRTDDSLTTEGLQTLSSVSHTFDFLKNEPELYTIDDLKVKFS